MTASLVTRSQTWPLSAGNYQHIPKHLWVDGIQKKIFFPNFWSVAKSQFENPGMAVVLSGPLWARLGSVCKENMVFSVLGVQKYLPQSIWVEIPRHRKFFSVSAQCDLAETADAPAPSLQASPYVPDTKLPDFFSRCCTVFTRGAPRRQDALIC